MQMDVPFHENSSYTNECNKIPQSKKIFTYTIQFKKILLNTNKGSSTSERDRSGVKILCIQNLDHSREHGFFGKLVSA
jgi:hypothetical protein